MMPTMRRLAIRLLLAAGATCAPAWAAATSQDDALAAWRLLDYVAVDYAEAVADGKVVNEGEYAEMLEFSAAIEAKLQALPPAAGREALVADAAQLGAAIRSKAAPAAVAGQAARLAEQLLIVYPVPTAPAAPPELSGAAALYAQHCASCHGAEGRGDGPAAPGMDPPPIDFHDRERHGNRSVFALYGTIANGVEGTAMPAFPALTDAQRWALAFHVGQMAYGAAERERGAALWQAKPAVRAALPSLAALVATTPRQLAATLGEADGHAVMAYLRAMPAAVVPAGARPLANAIELMRQSAAAAGSDRARATDLALSAYLDGFEPIEPALAVKDAALMRQIEAAMLDYRAALQRGVGATEIGAKAREVEALLARAEQALDEEASSAGAFVASFVILFREGLEAVLVLVAIVAGLRRMGRPEALPYVHAGWVAALALGAATWAAATWLIDVSGAQREATEGVTGLIAVAILVGVGLWLHSQALSGRWQTYLRQALQTHLSRNRLWGLTLLAFVAVYREAFEVVLFYRALWQQGAHDAVLAGMGAAAVALSAVSWSLFRASVKLPLRQFFLASAAFIAILAVVMAGHSAAALQEAGWVGVTAWPLPKVDWLGIHPTAQTIGFQLAVAAVLLVGLWRSRRRALLESERQS
jgi:high-affinity iron transporter